MKIGIDISQIVYGTGVSVYTKNLVKNLLAIDHENKYILFAGVGRRKKEIEEFSSELSGNFQLVVKFFPPTLADFVWNRLHTLDIERFIGKVDLFHSSDWAEPRAGVKKITTIHDLSPLVQPDLIDPKIVDVHRRKLEWVKKESDGIIVPSGSTMTDLVAHGFKQEKIVVIHEGVEEIFKPVGQDKIKDVKKTFAIAGEYLLVVGSNPRKNIKRIIEAYNKLPSSQNLSLVIVGDNYLGENFEGVKFIGRVSDLELVSLYSGASALIYATLYEGFGLPVIQAMACGCPVVTSNVSSLPEIAGKAAFLVDPLDVGQIALGVETVLKKRATYIKNGYERVRSFTWKKMARETLMVYSKLEN